MLLVRILLTWKAGNALGGHLAKMRQDDDNLCLVAFIFQRTPPALGGADALKPREKRPWDGAH